MTDTKRADELEAGDRVIFSGCKGVLTISTIEKIPKHTHYKIFCEGVDSSMTCPCYEEVTYLGNKKEEKPMKNQKVDCSALYPYFDSLANEELTFKDNNVPVYVYLKHQLKYIHELFEGVLDLTLEEVKALYFERKMSKKEVKSEYKKFPKTVLKKVEALQPGDKVVIPNMGDGVVTKLVEDNFGSDKSLIRVEWVCDNAVRVNLLNKERELVLLN